MTFHTTRNTKEPPTASLLAKAKALVAFHKATKDPSSAGVITDKEALYKHAQNNSMNEIARQNRRDRELNETREAEQTKLTEGVTVHEAEPDIDEIMGDTFRM